METKTQGETLILPSGFAAGRKDFRITLDAEYSYASGYYAIQNTTGGLVTQWKLGVKDDSHTYIDIVNGQHFQCSTNVEIIKRYKKQIIKAKGKTITVTLEIFEATTSELSIDLIFELHKGEMPNCPPAK